MPKAKPKSKPSISDNGGKPYLDNSSQKALINRLSRIEGHVGSIKRMIQDRRCADEVLIQVAAVKAAMNKFSASLLEHELKTCMDSCMAGDSDERLEKVTKVLSTLLKQS